MLSFSEKVYNIVKKIPRGTALTYKQAAKMAGNFKTAQAVGNILSKNYNSDFLAF
jgi:alkylated DNA nucleotide flippase Atl1